LVREVFAHPWSLPESLRLSNYTTAFDSGFGRAALDRTRSRAVGRVIDAQSIKTSEAARRVDSM
jgi:hypothetical protein